MGVQVGNGEFTFDVLDEWGTLPRGWPGFGDIGGVAVDEQDQVYVFNRSDHHPMVIFDRDGNFLTSWGENTFSNAHGIHIGPDGMVYCTDNGDHTVRKCTPEGEVLLLIGVPGKPSAFMSGEPFRRCTHTALSPEGDIYVSDGYENNRIHKFSPDGTLLMSWGSSGIGEGEFNLPHNIGCDADGWVYVADRENHRVQVFDGNGHFETQWHNMHRPSGLYTVPGHNPITYVGECGPVFGFNRGALNLGPRVSIFSHTGELLARLGNEPTRGIGPGKFISPHGMAVDSHGDLYVGDVSVSGWKNIYGPDVPPPEPYRSLQKFVKATV